MGRKQKRLWKYILLFPAACLILLHAITGCQLSVENPDLRPRQDQQGELSEISAGLDTTSELDQLETQLLDQADASMKDGEVVQALQSVADAISCCKGHSSDRALDIITIALAHPNYRRYNHDHSISCEERLDAAFSKLGYGPTTACWLAALSELLATETENQRLRFTIESQERKIQILRKQIAQLKAVDLEFVQPESAVEVP